MAEDRQWYPADWVDESCPLHKASPDGFIVAEADGSYWLGYAADDEGVLADERETLNQPLAIGDVVNFMCCDCFDDVEAWLFRSGELRLLGAIPPEHNNVTINGDIDTLCESFDDLAAALRDPREDMLDHVDYLFEDNNATRADVTLCFARWSDPLPHQLSIEDGKPVFRQMPAPKALN